MSTEEVSRPLQPARLERLRQLFHLPQEADWHESANCKSVGNWPFQISLGGTINPAVLVCKSCPVMNECLVYALMHEPRDIKHKQGVWGGLSITQRDALEGRIGKRASARSIANTLAAMRNHNFERATSAYQRDGFVSLPASGDDGLASAPDEIGESLVPQPDTLDVAVSQ